MIFMEMLNVEKNQIIAQTWVFIECALSGSREKLFMDEFSIRWLRYLEKQHILELHDEGVGLGILGLTAKGQAIVDLYSTEELWAKSVGPIIIETGDLNLTTISYRKPCNVIWRIFLTFIGWIAVLAPIYFGLMSLKSCS